MLNFLRKNKKGITYKEVFGCVENSLRLKRIKKLPILYEGHDAVIINNFYLVKSVKINGKVYNFKIRQRRPYYENWPDFYKNKKKVIPQYQFSLSPELGEICGRFSSKTADKLFNLIELHFNGGIIR